MRLSKPETGVAASLLVCSGHYSLCSILVLVYSMAMACCSFELVDDT